MSDSPARALAGPWGCNGMAAGPVPQSMRQLGGTGQARRLREPIHMAHHEPLPNTRSEIDSDLESGNAVTISSALISAALNDPDRPYVERQIERFLCHEHPWVRGAAACAAGHLVRVHGTLSSDRLVPLISALLSNPQTSTKAQDSLDEIETFLAARGWTSGRIRIASPSRP